MQVIIIRCESYLHLGVKQTKECRGKAVHQKKFIRREKKWKKLRREEEEGSCSNFKHNDAIVLNNDIKTVGNGGGKKNRKMLINGKATVKDNDFNLKSL